MGWFKKYYELTIMCTNCGKKSVIKILRGKTIKEHLDEKLARCDFCGCDTVNKNGEE